MVNPIYQQGEGLLLNPLGSKLLGAGAYTAVNSSEFVAQEDTIISVLTGGDVAITEDNIDYKTSMNLGSVTLKKGALIVAPVGEAFKSITIDSGVIIAYNCVTGGTKPSSVSILLDLYPGASAAFSLRRLRTAYSGSAIRVRRTDNAEQDIGFVNNQLDTVSLLAFVGSGDGFVSKWYDQSTGNDMGDGIQTTATLQPKIADSGAVTLFNGLPVVKFADSGMEFDSLITNSNVRTIFTTFNTSGTAEQQIFINSSVDGKRMQCSLYRSGAGKLGVLSTLRSPANGNTGGSITAGQSLITAIQKSDALLSFIDNSQVSDNNASRGGASLNRLGYLTANNRPLIGGISEYIIYNADKSTDRAAIETNINDFYSIY